MGKKTRKSAFVEVLAAILIVGFAAFLFYQKYGFSLAKGNRWDVHFEDLSASVVGSASYTLPKFSNTILTDYNVLLKKPGDSVTFSFQVVNDGNMPARLSDIVKSIPRCNGLKKSDETAVCQNLTYRLSNEDGSELEKDISLLENSSKQVKLTVEYPKTSKVLSEESVMIDNLDVDLIFVKE